MKASFSLGLNLGNILVIREKTMIKVYWFSWMLENASQLVNAFTRAYNTFIASACLIILHNTYSVFLARMESDWRIRCLHTDMFIQQNLVGYEFLKGYLFFYYNYRKQIGRQCTCKNKSENRLKHNAIRKNSYCRRYIQSLSTV